MSKLIPFVRECENWTLWQSGEGHVTLPNPISSERACWAAYRNQMALFWLYVRYENWCMFSSAPRIGGDAYAHQLSSMPVSDDDWWCWSVWRRVHHHPWPRRVGWRSV